MLRSLRAMIIPTLLPGLIWLSACDPPTPTDSSDVVETTLEDSQSPLRIGGTSSDLIARKPDPVFFVNGVRISDEDKKGLNISPGQVENVRVLRGETARTFSAPEEAELVVLITLRKEETGG